MRFSIITPTLQRESLRMCCQSLDEQTFRDWQHIVFVDADHLDTEMVYPLSDERRIWLCDGKRYNNFGNTPRHIAWNWAKGEYALYLDDDNTFSSPRALSDIHESLEGSGNPDWAIFPITRFGDRFFDPNPGVCRTDTANMVIKREIAQWPNRDEYTLDGIFAEQLKGNYPFATFKDVAPIIVVPTQGRGL